MCSSNFWQKLNWQQEEEQSRREVGQVEVHSVWLHDLPFSGPPLCRPAQAVLASIMVLASPTADGVMASQK